MNFNVLMTLRQSFDIVNVSCYQVFIFPRGILLLVLLLLLEFLHRLLVLRVSEPELVLQILDDLVVRPQAAEVTIHSLLVCWRLRSRLLLGRLLTMEVTT